MKTIKKSIVTGLVATMLIMMAAVGVAMAADSITGTITAKGDIIVLDAADGSYVLEGNDMAPDMVGKMVKVTGTVAEKENVKVINVISMEEVKE
jgi:hypothetical protein